HDGADGRVIVTFLVADPTYCRDAAGEADAKAYGMSAGPPAGNQGLDRCLYVLGHSDGTQDRQVRAEQRGIPANPTTLPPEKRKGRLIMCDAGADGGVVLADDLHDFLGLDAAGKIGESAQVAEDHNDVGGACIEQAAFSRVLNDLRDLRGEESLQPGDALRAL